MRSVGNLRNGIPSFLNGRHEHATDRHKATMEFDREGSAVGMREIVDHDRLRRAKDWQ